PQGFAAAAAFAVNFFAAAGIEAVSNEGFATAQEAAGAFRASGCKIACICAPGTVSTHTLIDAAMRLREEGTARICLAGREPEELETALLEAGIDELICAGSDTLAILEDTLAVALRERQS
ncbi:MAG: methylmalonyl-CoA mutase, partial [Methylocella sp.]